MAYIRPKRWSYRFELQPGEPGDEVLHDHLTKLAQKGRAAEWVKETLRRAIPVAKNTPLAPVCPSMYNDVQE